MFVSEYYLPHIGGVEVLFQNLAEELAREGHECHVVTCKLPGTKSYEEVAGVNVHRARVPEMADRYWFTFLAIPKVLKLARKADLIHTTTINAAFPAWLASRLLRKKSIVTVHEVWGALWTRLPGTGILSGTLYRRLERVIISLGFAKHVCVSRYTRNCLRLMGVEDRKLEVIHSALDYELFNPERDGSEVRRKLGFGDEFVYMYYGRPGVSKGVEYLIEAVPSISEMVPGSRLLLILTGEPRGRYEYVMKLMRDLNIGDKIVLLSPVPKDELPDYIAASDCVVVPSLSEGFGLAAAEACAMGKPVVATDVASLPEVVSGKCVWVRPGSPEAIAKAVAKVYCGEVEDIPRKTFTWEECVERYLEVYNEVLSG